MVLKTMILVALYILVEKFGNFGCGEFEGSGSV